MDLMIGKLLTSCDPPVKEKHKKYLILELDRANIFADKHSEEVNYGEQCVIHSERC